MQIEERIQGKLLSSLSTFGIGGPARFYCQARTIEELSHAIRWAREENLPFFILGNGSNCLFDDRGYKGLVIHNRLIFCEQNGLSIQAGAGMRFSLLGHQTAQNNLGGLEFALGIPGTVGGAVYMNAGANGQDTSQTLQEVSFLSETGEVQTFLRRDLAFSHRHSSFHQLRGSILSARFLLRENPFARARQLEMIQKRTASQPVKEKSAGCVFRNPSDQMSAGALIDRCGCKGWTVGGAQVSQIHANFIINRTNALAQDVRALMRQVQDCVLEKSGVRLEPEICWVPFE
jgi:UDP-N-acetylmuramate dehydrogenase